ncbi:CPOX [Bugula neritina]|uniref:coproporphyrinogen oxidase n=1 Tax=Bugula neritina TaxID=10212 RepID=A0A7J7K127_BUGNE|nr:CPOX [Bugula neritina]
MAAKRFASLLFGNSMRAFAVSAQRNARKFYSAGALLAATGGAMMGTAMIVAKDPIGLDDEEMKINIEEFMCQPITDMNTLEKSEEMMHKMELLCMQLQGQLCRELERIEGTTKFRVDRWLKCEQIQGGGVTCIMEDGAVFERAGVNISVVGGKLRSEAVRAMNSQ